MAKNTGRRRLGFWVLAALAGVVSAAVFLAAAEVVALLVARDSSPILAVGSFVIDIVPRPFKEFAIATFGEYDKIALLAGLASAVLFASAAAGVLQYLKPPLGVAALVVAGGLSLASDRDPSRRHAPCSAPADRRNDRGMPPPVVPDLATAPLGGGVAQRPLARHGF